MSKETADDGLAVWEARVARREAWRVRYPSAVQGDRWRHRAADFARTAPAREAARRRARALFGRMMQVQPGLSLLDIGAGTGVWTAAFAERGCRVTAVEPSPAMRAELERTVAGLPGGSVAVVPGAWPMVEVPPHDVVLCAHVLYGVSGFCGWIQAMMAHARWLCVAILRAPDADDVWVEAEQVLGNDAAPLAPGAQHAVRALQAMGLAPQVLMEAQGVVRHETFLDEAALLAGLKREFYLPPDPTPHDEALRALLAKRARRVADGWTFPPRARNAIILWTPPFAPTDFMDQLRIMPESL